MNYLAHLAIWVAALSTAVNAASSTEQMQGANKPTRVVQEDPILGKQYHKQQYELRDGKLCPVDTFGNREHHKPCLTQIQGMPVAPRPKN